jgi:hypothetical protein
MNASDLVALTFATLILLSSVLRRIALRGKRSNSRNPCLSLNQAWSVETDGCGEAVVFYGSARHRCPQLGVERAEHLKDSCRASALKQCGSFPRDGAAKGAAVECISSFFMNFKVQHSRAMQRHFFLKQGTAENRVTP